MCWLLLCCLAWAPGPGSAWHAPLSLLAFGAGAYALAWAAAAALHPLRPLRGWLPPLWLTSISGSWALVWAPAHLALLLGWGVLAWARLRRGGWWGLGPPLLGLLGGGAWACAQGDAPWAWDPIEVAAAEQAALALAWPHTWANGARPPHPGLGAGGARLFRHGPAPAEHRPTLPAPPARPRAWAHPPLAAPGLLALASMAGAAVLCPLARPPRAPAQKTLAWAKGGGLAAASLAALVTPHPGLWPLAAALLALGGLEQRRLRGHAPLLGLLCLGWAGTHPPQRWGLAGGLGLSWWAWAGPKRPSRRLS